MSTRRTIFYLSLAFLLLVLVGIPTKSQFFTQAGNGLIAGRNVNMVSGTQLPLGDPWLQRQNEPSIAVSSRNPIHLFAAANDYRTIDMPDDYSLPGIPGASAVRDSWIGVFESFNGGESSVTMLLPGFPQDTSAEGVASPIHGFDTACDPIVRAGARGLFYLSGIAFNRNQQQGVVFVSRYVDFNNRESVQEEVDPGSGYKRYVGPIQYIDTKAIDRDTQRRFIDMPNMAVDVPRGGAAYGNVYVAYTVFLGDTTRITRSRILLVRSSDGGVTWSWPRILSEFQYLVQRPVIVIDPSDATGKTIYIVFRRFAFLNKPDGIAFVKSVNGGISFSGPKDIATLPCPFDQGTTESSFRTNSYPTMAVDGNGIVYVAWAQRYGLDGTPHPDGQARIVISYSQNRGLTWSQPFLVDSYQGDGHQFMPTMTCGGGKLRLAWYDQRDDDSLQHPNPKFIEDAYPHRHTIDVRAIEGTPGAPPAFQSSILVSRYLYFMLLDENGEPKPFDNGSLVMQGEYNFINFPLFHLGTKPFHGDYMEIVSSPQILPPPASPSNSWVFNTSAAQPTTCPVIWTDTRDVWPPAGNIWGDWTTYNPPTSTQDGDFGQQNPCSNEDHTGLKNQNIYTANLNHGVIVGSPGNTKQLDIERTFIVSVRNSTELAKELSLDLFPSSGVPASFEQFSSQSSLAITVEPFSSVSATVYAGPSGSNNGFGSIRVDVTEGGTLVGRIFLNPDSTNSPILDPGGNPLSSEFHNPLMSNPKIWQYYVGNQDEPNAIFLSPRAQNPRAQNSGYVNPRAQNEGILNPRAQNPRAQNPRAQNENIVNNEMYNPRAQNPRAQNAALTDMTWTVTNDGNTTSAYSFDIVSNDAEDINQVFDDDLLIAQVLVYKMHTVPIDQKCALLQTHSDELIVNVTNPRAQNPRAQNYAPGSGDFTTLGMNATTQDDPEMPPDITFYLAPGEEAEVVLRVYDPIADDEFSIDDVIVDDIAGETEAEAANTGDTAPILVTQPDVPWVPSSQLSEIGVSPSSLSFEAVLGTSPDAQTIIVWNSGNGTLSYTISDDAGWLSVSPSSGTSHDYYETIPHTVSVDIAGLTPGTYHGTISIADPYASNNPARVPVTLTLYAVAPLNASSSAVPTSGLIPLTVDFSGSATGGTPPYSYSWDFGDGGSSSAQNPSHTFMALGSFSVGLTVTDYESHVDASDPITISANSGAANKLVFMQSPSGGVSGALWATQPIVEVQDALGYTVTSDDSTVVTLAIANNPGNGSLPGPFSMTVTDGVAAFNDLSIDKGGWGYTLEATSTPPLTPDTSESFNIEGFSETINPLADVMKWQTATPTVYAATDMILIAGGLSADGTAALSDYCFYDPSTNDFVYPGINMNQARYLHTATSLLDGTVLFVGGHPNGQSAEIFNPATGNFTSVSDTIYPHVAHRATVLQDGRVLVTGNMGTNANSAEVYDPQTGTFEDAGLMNHARNRHTSTLLPNGKVLIAGGHDSEIGAVSNLAELYDSATGVFIEITGGMAGGARMDHQATLLDNGTVLLTGGDSSYGYRRAEIYDPTSTVTYPNGHFQLIGNMLYGHERHQAALLRDGTVLLIGGNDSDGENEIYDPSTSISRQTGPMSTYRLDGAAAVLSDGRVLITGGYIEEGIYGPGEVWNPLVPFPTNIISGTITPNGTGADVGGIMLVGLPGHPLTNQGGYYEGLVIDGWSGTVTPTKPGYTFDPESRAYTGVTDDMTGQDYTTTGLLTYTISGTVTVGGEGLESVVMSGLPGNPSTNSDGFYTATVNYGWSGTATPTLAYYHFSPSSQPYSSVTSNQTTNYTAVLTQYQLNVNKAGTGTGTVTSDDGGINCGGTCSANYDYGTNVQLTATFAPGSTFGGWSGDIPAGHESDNPVTITIDGNKSVTATFNLVPILVLDHFDIGPSPIGTQIIDTPFPITITAKDSGENVVTTYSGTNTLSVNFYPYTNISPANVTLANGVWQGNVTITAAQYGVVISTSGGGKSGKCNAFDVLYPGPYSTISGQITYNGSPFLTDANVDFSLFDYGAGHRYPVPPSSYNPLDGTFSIPNVRSGMYDIYLRTDGDIPPNYLPYPGDYQGGSGQFVVSAPAPVTKDVSVYQIIHLTAPVDNNPPPAPGIPVPPPYPGYSAPVTFQWEAIPEATTYEIYVWLCQDDPYQILNDHYYHESGITGIQKNLILPISDPNQHYEFVLIAYNASTMVVGELNIVLTNPGGGIFGFRGSYQFKVTGVATYTISGTVTLGGSPLEGVLMSGLPGDPSTNALGEYTATVDYGWDGTVTPTLAGYTFTPPSSTYTNVTASQTADYEAALATYTLTVSKAGTGAGTTISDDEGIYCGSDCNELYESGTSVHLTAAWAPGSMFVGWTGDVPAGHESDKYLSITMDGNKSLIATFDLAPALVITTTSVPDGIKNTAYDTTLQSAGGLPPVTWSISSGSLPAGLNLNPDTGQISGIPSVSGYSSFTVQAQDASSQAATKALSMTIADWVARYNGPGNAGDASEAIAVDSLGNIYVAGSSRGSGTGDDYSIIKYDSAGVEQWIARYNGPDTLEDRAEAIAVDSFGNVYVTGHSYKGGRDSDYATIKYDSSGVEQWVARYDGPGNDSDHAFAIAVDSLGNVYVAGSSYGSGTISDYTTIKYDSAGIEQWVARYNGPGNYFDGASAIAVDSLGNVYVTGDSTASATDYDYATIKYNSSGVEQWVARYDGPGNSYDYAVDIAVDLLGNVYITGLSAGSGTENDYATIKYDGAGIEQWVARYNGPGNAVDEAHKIGVDRLGNVYVTGYSVGSGTEWDYATIKYDSSGVEKWVARHNGPGNARDDASSIAVDPFGNVYVTGRSVGIETGSDYATLKYDGSGVEQWVTRYNGPGNVADRTSATAVDSLGNVYVTGESAGSGTGYDYATIRYTQSFPDTLIITTETLDNGYVGVPYAAAVWAFGGSGARTWSKTSGDLPPGMELSPITGIISGTPTTPGTSNFTIQVADGSLTATKPLILTIERPYDLVPVPNHSFEEVGSGGFPHDWVPVGGAVYASDATVSRTGQRSVSIVCPTGDCTGRDEYIESAENITLSGQHQYKFSCWFKYDGTGTPSDLDLVFLGITYTAGWTTQGFLLNSVSKGEWKKIEFMITLTPSQPWIRMRLGIDHSMSDITVWFDDVEIRRYID